MAWGRQVVLPKGSSSVAASLPFAVEEGLEKSTPTWTPPSLIRHRS